MKAGVLALAAALATGVVAHGNHAHRHAHEAMHLEKKALALTTGAANGSCDCTTIYTTITGAATIIGITPSSTSVAPPPPPPTTSSSSTSTESTSSSSTESSTSTTETPAPTPEVASTPESTSSAAPETTEAPAPVYSAPAPASTDSGSSSSDSDSSSSSSDSSSSSSSSSGSDSSSSKSVSSSSGGFSGSIGSGGDQWAITYTPYSNSGGCKSSIEVYADVAIIKLKGFSAIRTYSTDCSTLENVGGAAKLSGLKLILGVFISSSGISGAQDQVSAITSWGQAGNWDMVELIVPGNEAIFNGYCSASDLAAFISSSAATWKAAGYSGPVTTTEPLNIWQEGSNAATLCAVVDVAAANIHPFFNSAVSCDDAGSFTKSQLDIVDALCPGKNGLNLETGWPMSGTANGAAVPGVSEQATAIAGIKAAVGGKSVMFSFSNDLWKPLGAFDCEQSWGMVNLFADL